MIKLSHQISNLYHIMHIMWCFNFSVLIFLKKTVDKQNKAMYNKTKGKTSNGYALNRIKLFIVAVLGVGRLLYFCGENYHSDDNSQYCKKQFLYHMYDAHFS